MTIHVTMHNIPIINLCTTTRDICTFQFHYYRAFQIKFNSLYKNLHFFQLLHQIGKQIMQIVQKWRNQPTGLSILQSWSASLSLLDLFSSSSSSSESKCAISLERNLHPKSEQCLSQTLKQSRQKH